MNLLQGFPCLFFGRIDTDELVILMVRIRSVRMPEKEYCGLHLAIPYISRPFSSTSGIEEKPSTQPVWSRRIGVIRKPSG